MRTNIAELLKALRIARDAMLTARFTANRASLPERFKTELRRIDDAIADAQLTASAIVSESNAANSPALARFQAYTNQCD